jgi:hypothetical protein
MDYLTKLVFIEISRVRGQANDLELRHGYATQRSRGRRVSILRALTTPILRRRRSARPSELRARLLRRSPGVVRAAARPSRCD